MSDNRESRAKKNILVSLGSQIVVLLCGIVVPRTMIGTFGSEAYGASASIVQFLSYITLLEGGIGGVARAGTKKLKATLKGDEYQYGNITKISVFKNQLPTPYNVTYSGTMCCVHNGIISEDDIDKYKKEHLPLILERIKQASNKVVDGGVNDIVFSEEGDVE